MVYFRLLPSPLKRISSLMSSTSLSFWSFISGSFFNCFVYSLLYSNSFKLYIKSILVTFSIHPINFPPVPPSRQPLSFSYPTKNNNQWTNIHKHESRSSLKLMKLCFDSELLCGFSLRMNVPNIWIETEEKPNISYLFLPINSKFHPLLRFDL